jgi:myo-inositol 2-dehydrogenase / D-chiro-inositol 1-dehydrogenase
VRLCQVGCGEHARTVHGPAQARLARERPGLILAACCDKDAARAEAYRTAFGFGKAYSDLEEMLDAERPEAVILVVPVEATVRVATTVLTRGIPTLLEKPPGATVGEVDRLIAASEAGGRGGRPVPHQVAFNRRYVPLVQELRRRLEVLGLLQHLHYEMVRVDRRDPDFSTTAIHGIDAVRYLAGCDYATARFRYREMPDLGKGVANIFVDATMASGATAHLAFCPAAGVVVERAVVHVRSHTFLLHVPMWGGADSPGRLLHFEGGRVVEDLSGEKVGDGSALFELGGFYRETAAFLDALEAGHDPSPGLRDSRQSVEIAEHIRARRECGATAGDGEPGVPAPRTS